MFVVQQNNKVKYTQVTVNPKNDGQNYIIESGLKTGDRIVVKGVSGLTDGADIKPLTEEQYAKKLKKTEEMGAHQSDLKKLKEDLGGK